MNMEQVIKQANHKAHTKHGQTMNSIVYKRNKGSIFDVKLREKIEREFKSIIYDKHRGVSAYSMDCRYDHDEIGDWGDMEF